MKLIQTKLKQKVIEYYEIKAGTFYFFEHTIISELNEGVHFDYDLIKNHLGKAKDFYNDRPFGYISNRINDISINALDYPKFKTVFNNLLIHAVVNYEHSNSFNIAIEERFCNTPYINFKNVEQSYDYVTQYIVNDTFKIA